jgi:hypothetical protein
VDLTGRINFAGPVESHCLTCGSVRATRYQIRVTGNQHFYYVIDCIHCGRFFGECTWSDCRVLYLEPVAEELSKAIIAAFEAVRLRHGWATTLSHCEI